MMAEVIAIEALCNLELQDELLYHIMATVY
jgi:hypothetical protein